jgi:hypothetical protein
MARAKQRATTRVKVFIFTFKLPREVEGAEITEVGEELRSERAERLMNEHQKNIK